MTIVADCQQEVACQVLITSGLEVDIVFDASGLMSCLSVTQPRIDRFRSNLVQCLI